MRLKKLNLKTQHWIELLRIGIFTVQASILKKTMMGMDRKEEEIFWTLHQLADLSVPAGYTDW